jgi:hypothetical protein
MIDSVTLIQLPKISRHIPQMPTMEFGQGVLEGVPLISQLMQSNPSLDISIAEETLSRGMVALSQTIFACCTQAIVTTWNCNPKGLSH